MGEDRMKRIAAFIVISLFFLQVVSAEPEKVSIYLDADFGTSHMAVASGYPGAPVPPLPELFFSEGHEFDSWMMYDTVTKKNEKGQIPVVFPEHNLFCTLIEKPVNLTITLNGFGMLTEDNASLYDYAVVWREPLAEEYDEWDMDRDEFLPGTPFSGNKFYGWSLEPDGEVVYRDCYPIHVQENTTLYAVWKYNPFLGDISSTGGDPKELLTINSMDPDSYMSVFNRLSALCACVVHMDTGQRRSFCIECILDTLNSLYKTQLRILRNAFFAQHGYVFKDEFLKAFFSKGTYTPDPAVTSESITLSEGEEILISLIQKLEAGQEINQGSF